MSAKRQSRRRWLLPVIVAGTVLSLGAWRGMSATSTTGVSFRIASLQRSDLLVSISATGTVEPEEVVDVGAQVAGMIREFGQDPQDSSKSIDYGTVVEKGTVLAEIDDAPYRAAVNRAKALVAQAEAGVKQAEAQVLQAEANAERAKAEIEQLTAKLNLAELEQDRSTKLISRSAISTSDHDTAKSTFESARAALAVGNANVAQTKAAIDDAKASVLKVEATLAEARVALESSEINLGYCTIKSPVDGVIIDRRVNIGQTVVASLNTPSLFLIAKDLKRVQVWASVNEADIGKVQKGLDVQFRVDAHPDKVYQGKIAQIRLNAVMTQNVVTYTVVVTADNSDGLLLPYLTANVEIKVDERKNVLVAPNSALRWQPEEEQIAPSYRDEASTLRSSEGGEKGTANRGVLWVAEGRFVRPLQITKGFSDGAQTEISGDGLIEDLNVVTSISQVESKESGGNPFIPQIPGKKKQ